MRPLVLVRDLLVQRGRFTLEIPYMELARGETLALVGPNGSGKSTLLMVLGLLLRPKRGVIQLCGEKTCGLASPLALRRKVAMVFQEPLLLKGTVLKNVLMGLRLRGLKGKAALEGAVQALERLGVAHLCERDAASISGGEAQRVSLARALALEPELLLLDEPFSSLDPPSRDRLLDDLEALLFSTGTTAVMSTHDRLDEMGICKKVAVMQEGRLLQLGHPREVIQNPAHPFVAEFLDLGRTARVLESLMAPPP